MIKTKLTKRIIIFMIENKIYKAVFYPKHLSCRVFNHEDVCIMRLMPVSEEYIDEIIRRLKDEGIHKS